MNKIHELTIGQAIEIMESVGKVIEFESDVLLAENVYLQALKVADEQGLLTKDASLGIKPANWIEWRNYVGISKCGKIHFHYNDKFDSGTNYSVIITHLGVDRFYIDEKFTSFESLKKYCQNWLNDFLIKNKEF